MSDKASVHPIDRLMVNIGVAFFFAIVLARAHLQSITIDEATTYDMWIRPLAPDYWYAASNNHILNSILIRLATTLFGLSHLTVRCGAIVGALVYLLAIRWFCLRALELRALKYAGFVCLAANPFLLDYLVAARGYGLAMGFLTWLILVASFDEHAFSAIGRCALCSLLAGLCVASNFSFGVVACVALGSAVGWIYWRNRPPFRHFLAASLLPAALVMLFLTSHAIATWPVGQLGYGADSLVATFGSVMESSIYKPNRYVLNLFLMPLFEWIGPVLIPLVLLIAIPHAILNRNSKFCLYVGFVLCLSLGAHWMTFRMLGAKLPMERTAIFIPLLVTFFVIAAAASVPASKIGTVLHRLLLAVIVVTAVYFGSCLRLSYFKEWEWDAEVRQAYVACRNYKGTVVSSWFYTSPLNFYRWMLHDDKMAEVRDGNPTPPGDVYVLHGLFDAELIDARRLKVVFKGDHTDIVVAIPAAP